MINGHVERNRKLAFELSKSKQIREFNLRFLELLNLPKEKPKWNKLQKPQ